MPSFESLSDAYGKVLRNQYNTNKMTYINDNEIEINCITKLSCKISPEKILEKIKENLSVKKLLNESSLNNVLLEQMYSNDYRFDNNKELLREEITKIINEILSETINNKLEIFEENSSFNISKPSDFTVEYSNNLDKFIDNVIKLYKNSCI